MKRNQLLNEYIALMNKRAIDILYQAHPHTLEGGVFADEIAKAIKISEEKNWNTTTLDFDHNGIARIRLSLAIETDAQSFGERILKALVRTKKAIPKTLHDARFSADFNDEKAFDACSLSAQARS